ncbi:sugar phosphate isomerase/epimerase family protein [Reichenbachiella ulvae]|uniref:Sugar phosphate isomerase/epimerase n=1 Tax=Reichenbachiella ulvae TaxID=2980104 RepID=A0ABT3CN35_9BACT|nr:sugar phosphate isomerase/epimerase [Reichenbachiella ulvae]MCV9385128.1 sugar phosphate isomerase/epimerase [Reichenbachiella ulvae]
MNFKTNLLLGLSIGALAFCSPKKQTEEKPETTIADPKKESTPIGLQLYTVRDAMAANPDSTLELVAKLGYKQLELAGYADGKFYGMAPEQFKSTAEGYGLSPISAHISIDALAENPELAISASKAAGLEYVVLPWLSPDQRNSVAQYESHIALMNKVGPMCSEAGLKFAYHNHAFEFDTLDGQVPMEMIINQTNPEHVAIELDLYWVSKAGLDPVAFFNKYPGRFNLWHVKDMDDTPEQNFTEVGSGTIDYKSIFENAEVSDMQYFFVEQDRSDNPMKSIEISYQYVDELLNQ